MRFSRGRHVDWEQRARRGEEAKLTDFGCEILNFLIWFLNFWTNFYFRSKIKISFRVKTTKTWHFQIWLCFNFDFAQIENLWIAIRIKANSTAEQFFITSLLSSCPLLVSKKMALPYRAERRYRGSHVVLFLFLQPVFLEDTVILLMLPYFSGYSNLLYRNLP